jgi:hypothetical protein
LYFVHGYKTKTPPTASDGLHIFQFLPPKKSSAPHTAYRFSLPFFTMLDQMANEIKLIAGSSHPELSALVASRYLQIPLQAMA